MSRGLTLWIPNEASLPLYQRLTSMFMTSHADVDIQIEAFPFETYWDQVSEACRKKQGPDIFFLHNEYAQTFRANGFLRSYQFSKEQQEYLDNLYPASSNHHEYYDFAYLTSLLYTQRDVQLSAGGSWDVLIQELKQYTQYPYQLGCSINHDTQAAVYCMAELQYSAQAEQFLSKLFQVLQVSPLQEDSKLGFLNHDIAAVYSWGWFAGWLDDHNMEYQVYPLCKSDAAYIDRRNTKSSFGITAHCQDVPLANAFIYTFLSEEAMQLEFALTRKVIPLHQGLQQHPKVLADRVIQAQKQIINDTYFPQEPIKKEALLQMQRKIEQVYEQIHKK